MFRELLTLLMLLLMLVVAWMFGCEPLLPEALKKKKSEATCSWETACKEGSTELLKLAGTFVAL